MAHSVIIRNFVAQSHFECRCKVKQNISSMQENNQEKSPIKRKISLYLQKKGVTPYEFYKKSGVSRGILAQNNGITEDNLARFLAYATDVNPDWLLTGSGDMLKTNCACNIENTDKQSFACNKVKQNIPITQEKSEKNAEISFDLSVGTPYYDVDFFGGFSEIINDQTRLPACNIVVPGLERATVWCNVTGHSMEPRINHGDIIALRECTIQDIQYGETYAVVLDTIRTIKILRRGSSPSTLLYVPVNKSGYDDQEFDISRIIKIFEVVGSISKFF